MRLGIALNNLGASQLSYFLVKNANRHLRDNPQDDITAFIERHVANPLPGNFACMPTHEMWGYDAPVIATSFESARKLQACVCPVRKLFYVWDVEWVRDHLRRPYREWAAVYQDPSLSLIARGPDHAVLLQQLWGRTVLGMVEDFRIDALLALALAVRG